jgi:DNA polymerase-1
MEYAKRLRKVESSPLERQEPPVDRPLKHNPTCRRCDLAEKSLTVCCKSSGPAKADILLFGEALGAYEEELGRPFVGDSGRKLNYCLERAGLKRKRCRIANMVRCRPPKNKPPSKKQQEACWPYSLYDILRTRPKVIVALGAAASKRLLGGEQFGPDKWRGFYQRRTFRYWSGSKLLEHTCWIVPTYHPSAALHHWELDDLLVFDLEIARELAAGREPLKRPTTKVEVVRTLDQALALLRTLRRLRGFVIDLETTSLSPFKAKVMCIGFCWRSGHAIILPLYRKGPTAFWTRLQRRRILSELTEILEEAELYGQNVKFDLKHLRRLTGVRDFKVDGAHGFDTMIAHHVLDENKPHNLTFLSQWFLRWQKYDAAMDPYKTDKEFRTWEVPDEMLWRYCAFDVDATFQLRRILRKRLIKEKVVRAYKMEMDLILPLADVEFRGVTTDVDRIRQLSHKYRIEIAKHEKKITRHAIKLLGREKGLNFNPNSGPQLAELLKLAGAKLRKKTPTGKPSVDKYVTASLAQRKTRAGRIAKAITEQRRVREYVYRYLDGRHGDGGFLSWVETSGGVNRIHSNYNIALVRTGRLSADDPPIQTLPRVGGIRSMFVPDHRDHCLLSVDYEKLELCVMAWLANDHVMARELLAGIDLHIRMALTVRLGYDPTDELFEELFDSVEKDERAIAKGVNFGIPYGRGAWAIAEANPESFPLDWDKKQREARVQKTIDAWLEKYWGIAEYRERQVRRMLKRGELRTEIFNRARRFQGLDWYNSRWGLETLHRDRDVGHLEREALNFEIQSIGSDVLTQATKRVFDGIRRSRIPGFRPIMSIHDSLVYNVHRRHADEASAKIVSWMETKLPQDKRHKYEMPLRVEVLRQDFYGAEYGDVA